MKRYEWNITDPKYPIDADTVGAALAELTSASGGRLTTQAVVDASRPKDAPLHKCFTWDDKRAAELHRNTEASKLIRSVRVIHITKRAAEPVAARAYVPAQDESGEHFRPVTVITRAEQLRTAINTALDNLTAARDKLTPYQEVGKWCAGIKGCEEEVKAMREAAKKVCAQLEKIEDGLVEQLMPSKPQPVHDARRLASV
jgi:hypothetical protein